MEYYDNGEGSLSLNSWRLVLTWYILLQDLKALFRYLTPGVTLTVGKEPEPRERERSGQKRYKPLDVQYPSSSISSLEGLVLPQDDSNTQLQGLWSQAEDASEAWSSSSDGRPRCKSPSLAGAQQGQLPHELGCSPCCSRRAFCRLRSSMSCWCVWFFLRIYWIYSVALSRIWARDACCDMRKKQNKIQNKIKTKSA